MNVTEQLAQHSVMAYSWHLASEESTQRIAAQLARLCLPGDCILLRGEVGAGKTTFARAFIRAISPEAEEIVSPTFTLVQTYPTDSGGAIWHFDLYRLKHSQELVEIGIDDALYDGITLIEWPEVAAAMFPKSALELALLPGQTADQRILKISGDRQSWNERLAAIKENV